MSKPLILVTGATGTIGSRLVPLLVGRGARVRALVRDRRKAEALGSGFEVVTGTSPGRRRSSPRSRAWTSCSSP